MSHPFTPGQVLAGKYRVEHVLGQGGMGVVLAAWHLELDQRVVLKFLLGSTAERPDAAERFRREARAAARIKSEHVVRVLDVGTLDGHWPFMVMEYLDGNDLGREIELNGALPIAEAVDILLQAMEAVAEAHARGIVHRDLTPANLFLARRQDGARRVKVLDFGISKSSVLAADQIRLTQPATMMGSPYYMAPEQMRAPSGVDERADIWSLGAILYHALAGQPPHVADTLPLLCALVLEYPTTPLGEHRPEVPPELEDVVMRCLDKDRERRFGGVGELAAALAPFTAGNTASVVERAARAMIGGLVEARVSQANATVSVAVQPAATGVKTQQSRRDSDPTSPPVALRAASDGAVTDVAPPGQTAESWGRTDLGQAPRRSRRRAVAALGLGALLLGTLALVWVRPGSPSSGDAAAPTDVETSGVAAVAQPPSSPEPAAPPAPASETSPEPAVTPAPRALATAAAPRPRPGPPALFAQPAALRAPAPTSTSPTSMSPTSMSPTAISGRATSATPTSGAPRAGVEITDFGGRR